MSQPVKLSSTLVLDARLTGAVAERSIAGQIEYWAKLGRAVEPLLQGDQVLALCRAGEAQLLSTCLASVDTAAGRRRVAEHLHAQPYPHYEPAPEKPGLLIRIDADGNRALGHFVNRQFRVATAFQR